MSLIITSDHLIATKQLDHNKYYFQRESEAIQDIEHLFSIRLTVIHFSLIFPASNKDRLAPYIRNAIHCSILSHRFRSRSATHLTAV